MRELRARPFSNGNLPASASSALIRFTAASFTISSTTAASAAGSLLGREPDQNERLPEAGFAPTPAAAPAAFCPIVVVVAKVSSAAASSPSSPSVGPVVLDDTEPVANA